MTSSDILLNQLMTFESCQCNAYQDAGGVWTIGYGHTQGVRKGQHITTKQAKLLLQIDLTKYEGLVEALGVCKTQGQFDALVDFAYNLGIGNLQRSTLLKYIKQGEPYEKIRAEFLKWNKCKGKVLNGLTKRRQWEAERFAQ